MPITSAHPARRSKAPARLALAALFGGALAMLLPAAGAFAQTFAEPARPAASADGPGPGGPGGRDAGRERHAERGDRERHGGRDGMRHHHRGGGERFSTLRLAEALAGMETGLGIRPDQMETWRAFTGALVAFVDAARPGPRGGRDGGPEGRGPDEGAPPPAPGAAPNATVPPPLPSEAEVRVPPLDRLDRLADRAIEAGARAETLKTAIADLRATLTPEQAEMATRLARDFMRGMRGDRHEGRRGGRGSRD